MRKLQLQRSEEIDLVKKIFKDTRIKVYITGGYVRDLLMNKSPSDIDFAVNMTKEDIVSLVMVRFPLLKVVDDLGHNEATVLIKTKTGLKIDISTLKTQDYYSIRRKFVDERQIGTIEEDLSLRDFTINAMAIDLWTQELIDPFGGEKDLENCLIRTPIDPSITIANDRLRVFRALKFASRYGFNIDSNIFTSINKEQFADVPRNRILLELDAMMQAPYWKIGVKYFFTNRLGELPNFDPGAKKRDKFYQVLYFLVYNNDDQLDQFFSSLDYVKLDTVESRWMFVFLGLLYYKLKNIPNFSLKDYVKNCSKAIILKDHKKFHRQLLFLADVYFHFAYHYFLMTESNPVHSMFIYRGANKWAKNKEELIETVKLVDKMLCLDSDQTNKIRKQEFLKKLHRYVENEVYFKDDLNIGISVIMEILGIDKWDPIIESILFIALYKKEVQNNCQDLYQFIEQNKEKWLKLL